MMGKKQCAICGKEVGRFAIINVEVCRKFLVKYAEKQTSTAEILAKLLPETLPEDGHVCKECDSQINAQVMDHYYDEREQLEEEAQVRVEQYEEHFDKNAVVQFKNERIAILKRTTGEMIEFIIAYDDLTREGYRCVAQDESKESGLTGASGSFLYFQKIQDAD